MLIGQAQQEMRFAFLGGFAGQLVSGILWALSAAVGTWGQPRHGMLVLFFGSMLIFPLTQLLLRLLGRQGAVSPANELNSLARQIAFTVPVNFLLVGAAVLYRETWFFPAAMIAVGAHYLPFIFLYGMRMFGVLAALMAGGGFLLGLYGPAIFSLGGWITAGLLVIFAFTGRALVLREQT